MPLQIAVIACSSMAGFHHGQNRNVCPAAAGPGRLCGLGRNQARVPPVRETILGSRGVRPSLNGRKADDERPWYPASASKCRGRAPADEGVSDGPATGVRTAACWRRHAASDSLSYRRHRQALAWRWRVDDVVADDAHIVRVAPRCEAAYKLDVVPPFL